MARAFGLREHSDQNDTGSTFSQCSMIEADLRLAEEPLYRIVLFWSQFTCVWNQNKEFSFALSRGHELTSDSDSDILFEKNAR